MNITGSSVPLLTKCQWWANESVPAQIQSPPSGAMLLGTAVHSAIENYIQKRPGDVSEEVIEYFDVWHGWWESFGRTLGKGQWECEQAYVYDATNDTAKRVQMSGRRYVVEHPGQIAGTIDAVSIFGKHAIVIDWKTGDDFAKMTADAEHNWQLRLYALAVARAHNLESVRIMIVRISQDDVTTSSHDLDAIELDAVAAKISALVAGVPSAQPQPGTHCRRCRAVAVCPATKSATDAIAAPTPVEIRIHNQEQATAALVRLRQVQAACEQMESILKAYAAENGGIPLPDGKRWSRVSVERESINLTGMDGAAGISLIHSVGADDAVETKSSTSKAAIERSLKAQGLKGKELRAKADALYSELRACGVMRSSSVETYREG